ncbi:ABC transporter permease [Candidatus Venteria ishoeyi]|nr:FtsX-like permease family protein [Candidatus Venteria ishoeyi]MDM8548332.1 FtsX-like permease family protein [Candidatus Venteria ishoeyi]
MLEFTLSRYLVKPIFSIFLTIGAIIGIAALLIVLSLFQNYYLSMEKVFMGIHPHVEVHMDMMPQQEVEALSKRLKDTFPEILMVLPALYTETSMEIATGKPDKCVTNTQEHYGFHVTKQQRSDIHLKGVSVQNGRTVMDIESIAHCNSPSSIDCDLNHLADTVNENGINVPLRLYMEGSVFDFLTKEDESKGSKMLKDFLLNIPDVTIEPQYYQRTMLLDMGRKKDNFPLLVVSLKNAQTLLNKPNLVNTIEIKLTDPYYSTEFAQRIQNYLGDTYKVHSWTEKEQASFKFLQTAKKIAFMLIFSISMVAALGVYSTLLLAVMQNRKKIAILRALGIKNRSIYLIFVSKALSIALLGLFVGTFFGYLGSEWLLIQFAENLNDLGISNPKTEITLQDLALISLFTLSLFIITAIIPAKRATQIDPAENLQH